MIKIMQTPFLAHEDYAVINHFILFVLIGDVLITQTHISKFSFFSQRNDNKTLLMNFISFFAGPTVWRR